MPERDVRMRLGVTKEGDTEAFREVAEDIDATEAAAQSAAGAVDRFLDNLKDVNPSDYADLAAAVKEAERAIAEAGRAKGFEQQKAAVDRLETSLTSVRQVLSEAWEEGQEDLERYEETLEQVQAAQKTFGDPLAQQLRTVREAMDATTRAVAGGSEEMVEKLKLAAVQTQRLKEEIAAAKREGRDFSAAEAALERYEAQWDELRDGVARFRVEARKIDRDLVEQQQKIEGHGRAIGGLDDIFQNFADRGGKLVGTLGKVALGVGGVVFVWREAYRVGQDLARGIDFIAEAFFNKRDATDASATSINRWIGLTTLANKLAGESGQLGLQQEQILESQRTAFERLNIPLERYTNNVAENQALIAQAKLSNFEYAASIEEVANAFGLLTDRQLVEQANKVLFAVSDLLKEGFGLDRVREAVESSVQTLLSQLDRLPPAVRGNVQAMADTLGILPEAHEEAAAAAEDHSDRAQAAAAAAAKAEKDAAKERVKALESIADAFESLIERTRQGREDGEGSALQGDLEALEEERRKLQQKPVQTAEDLERIDELTERISGLKRELQEAGAAADGWSQETLASSEEVDAAIHQVVEGLRGTFDQLSLTQQNAIEEVLTRLQRAGEQGVASGDLISQAFSQVASVLESSVGPSVELQEALDRVQGKGLDVGRAFDSIRQSVTGIGTDAQQAGAAVQAAGEQITQGAATAAAGSVELEKVGERFRVTGGEVERAGISIRHAGEDVEATSLGLQAAGTAAQGAGAAMAGAGASAAEAGAGAREALPPFEDWVQEAGRLKGEVETSTISIRAHSKETKEAAGAAQEVGKATGEAAQGAKDLAEGSEQAATATASQAESSSEAASSMGELTGASESAATSQDELARAAGEAASKEEAAAQGAKTLATALDEVQQFDPGQVLAGLDAIAAKAEEVAARVEAAAQRINDALSVDDDAGPDLQIV